MRRQILPRSGIPADLAVTRPPTMGRLRALIAALRPSFLPLTLVCVFLGATAACWSGARIDLLALGLVLIGALAAHISVNTFNEYFDFRSGLDLQTVRTPFSGGSGALPAQPRAARLVLITASVSSALTIVCGLWLERRAGPGLIPLGILGLALVYTYTQWLNRLPWLGLIAPGMGFGLMVYGTDYVLTRDYGAGWLALPVFFLVNNLLLLNQFPDVEADRQVGRRHLPIVLGRRKSVWVLGAFFVSAYAALLAGVAIGHVSVWALLGLITVPLALDTFSGARRHCDDMHALLRYLGRNVQVALLTPLLIGMGLLFAVLARA